MKQKLIIDKQFTLEELQNEVNNGGRFVTYQYCISLFFAVTLRRFSPAILMTIDKPELKYKRKYNLISYLLGWWGIPWGPVRTIQSIKINGKGGIDVTGDIMLNMTKEGLTEKEIELKITNELFCEPDKWDKKAFSKALLREFEYDYNIKQLVVGLFINTENNVAPFYTIGLRVDNNYDKYIEPLKKALYTQFRKYTYFEFVNLSEENESYRLLEKQGEFIINRIKNAH